MSDAEQPRTIDVTADLIHSMTRENRPFINIAMAIDAHYHSLQPTHQAEAKAATSYDCTLCTNQKLPSCAKLINHIFEFHTRVTPPSIDKNLHSTLAHNVLGMTMTMVENCYENMDEEEFENFLANYHNSAHKYEPQQNRCDGCNGIDFAVDDISAHLQAAVRAATSCICDNVEFGTYAHTVSMKCPFIERNDGWVTIDVCIATEIAELWHKGVKTLNSCCGHQKLRSSVIVSKEYEPVMIGLGYAYTTLENDHLEFFLNSGTSVQQLKQGAE